MRKLRVYLIFGGDPAVRAETEETMELFSDVPWNSRGEERIRYREEINKENRTAVRLFALYGLPLSAMIAVTQWAVTGRGPSLTCGLIMILYFAVLAIAERWLLPQHFRHATALLYLSEAPVMLMAVLMGTVLDPTRQATTVLLFLVALPAFIMDRPRNLLLFTGGWVIVFLLLCFSVKEKDIRTWDVVHIGEFYFASVAVINVILRVRMGSLRHLLQEEYSLEHERGTNCLNRSALVNRLPSFVGQEIAVLLADMDRFMLYNDFYGHEAGDSIMRYFTATLMKCFGAENTFHYNGDEFLLMARGGMTDDCAEKMAQCRKMLDEFMLGDTRLPLTCTFGWVTGKPDSVKTFREMIQLANINTHKAKKTGPGGSLGEAFTNERLRAGVAESNMSTHAHASEINQLTGLPGMSYFITRADAVLHSVADMKRHPVVGFFKLVRMRDFNDTFGYAQGDALIAETARLLQRSFTGRYICYITAGQFGIMCYEGEVQAALKKTNEALQGYKPGFPVFSKAGFARYTGGESVISLLDRARLAEGTIEDDADADCRFYDQKIDAEQHFRQYIISHVDEAIRQDWLKVYYQPIVRAVTGHVCNEEALSRWDDPKYGFLLPARFIPILEDSGLTYKVNLHVVGQVLRDCKRRREMGVPVVPVSVNLSRRDFEQCDMVREISEMVDASGLPRSILKIEITESAFISNQELLKREVARFRSSGFDVWMDDFGSEYSTLNLMQELDFDLIKIDMQFMENFSAASRNSIIISDIIDMAKRMGITTLIEGVENREDYQALRMMGCEKIQGFLFNCPNPFDYIVHRALTGTGLTFEDPAAAPYLEAVSRIDLNEALSYGRTESDPLLNREIPAGVVELRGGQMICLRGTTRFLNIMDAWGILAPDDGKTQCRPFANLPERFFAAAVRCAETPGWSNFYIDTAAEGKLNIYLRRVSDARYRDAAAILVVLLHNLVN